MKSAPLAFPYSLQASISFAPIPPLRSFSDTSRSCKYTTLSGFRHGTLFCSNIITWAKPATSPSISATRISWLSLSKIVLKKLSSRYPITKCSGWNLTPSFQNQNKPLLTFVSASAASIVPICSIIFVKRPLCSLSNSHYELIPAVKLLLTGDHMLQTRIALFTSATRY